MKLKKILAGAMALVMVASSLLVAPVETKAAEADTATGLVGYYTFDDTLKNEVSELGAAKLHGGAGETWGVAATGTAAYESGKEGKAYSFTGDGETRGEGLELDVKTSETGAFSISLWVNTAEKVNYQPIVFTNIDGDNYVTAGTNYNDFASGGIVNYKTAWTWLDKNNAATASTLKDIPVDTWVYVTITMSAEGKAVLYYNAEVLASADIVGIETGYYKNMPIFLGVNWWDVSYKGLMDEVTVYDRALSADDVAALYAANGVPQIPVDTITLDVTEKNVTVGNEFTLTATTAPSYATVEPTITWTSSDATVAKVEDGKVTALKAGDATITASVSDTVKATCTVKVAAEQKPLTGIEATAGKTDLVYGEETTITVAPTPADTTDVVTATYKSSNSKVVTVDANGKVVAVGAGEATVTVTAGTFTDEIKFTVDDTTVVKLDDLTSTIWWDYHTAGIKIDEGRTYTFNFDAKSSDQSRTYFGPNYVVYTGSEAKVSGAGYTEIFVGRADNYGWIGADNTVKGLPEGYGYTVDKTYAEDKWEDYIAALKAGTEGTLTAQLEDGVLTIVSEVEGAKNTFTYKVSGNTPIYVSLFAEKATLSDITVTGKTIPTTGDVVTMLPLVLVIFGGAVVIVASKKRFA